MNTNLFILLSVCVLIFAAGLRFSRYSNRWGLAYDQAHDVLVARHAIATGQLPLLGPFSSAGPFQTSGVWYWFIMAGTVLFPLSVITPWYVLTLLYVLLVGGMIALGSLLENKQFGLLLGLLSAISTAQVAQSVNLTNQSPLAITSFAALTAFVLYGRVQRLRYLFFLGYFISLSASIHLQGVSLLILGPVALLFFGVPKTVRAKNAWRSFLVGVFIFLLGLFVPTVPIVLFDMTHNFINIKNMIYYIRIDQYNISLDVLGRRWKTFLGVFLPQEWAHIIGGVPYAGAFLLTGALVVLPFLRRRDKTFLALCLSLILMVSVIRYTRTPLYSSYLVFLHPFVLLLSSLFLYEITKRKKVVGVIFFLLVIGFSLNRSIREIRESSNRTNIKGEWLRSKLLELYPDSAFSVFDYHLEAINHSIILSLYLDAKGKIFPEGKKIAITGYPPGIVPDGNKLFFNDEVVVFDVSKFSTRELDALGWGRVNSEDIYNATQHWMEKK